MDKNNIMGFKRGSINRPLITVANKNQSKIVFTGTKKQHQKWLEGTTFRHGTVHHVYQDKGGNNVSYFRATKK